GDTITVTTLSIVARAMSVEEFSGIQGGVDRSATAISPPGGSTAVSVGPTATTSSPAELLLAVVGVETKHDDVLTPGAGYTALQGASTGNAGMSQSNINVDEAYQLVTATGAYTATGTLPNSKLWAGALVTYRARCGDGVIESGEQCDDGNVQ